MCKCQSVETAKPTKRFGRFWRFYDSDETLRTEKEHERKTDNGARLRESNYCFRNYVGWQNVWQSPPSDIYTF